MRLTSWGKYPVVEARLSKPRNVEQMIALLEKRESCIPRGLGRSYGDSALSSKTVVSCLGLDHMESFDDRQGVLVAETGVSLSEILDAFMPRGWFLPVTPGTKFVTLGGAVASDVHGKDHHVAGTFCQHVLWLDIWCPAYGVLRCSPHENADIFYATAGGMGLTGFILRVALQLQKIPSSYIVQDIVKAADLSCIMETFENSGGYPYSVAWIDCLQTGQRLGRSIFMGGRFAQAEELPAKVRATPYTVRRGRSFTVPMDFPSFTLNRWTVKCFNALYYGKSPKGKTTSVINYNTFFYPLDAVHDWNRIYGKRGFTQYQFVIPKEAANTALPKILSVIAESGQGSFLAVLKLFGRQAVYNGNISFPREGYTLALDFSVGQKLFPLLDRLDAMVLDYGGRHYLTKDCRLQPQTLARGYGTALEEFKKIKYRLNPDNMFASMQSIRLGL